MTAPLCRDCHEREAEYGTPLCESCLSDAEYWQACCVKCRDSVGAAQLTKAGLCTDCRPRTDEEIADAREEARHAAE